MRELRLTLALLLGCWLSTPVLATNITPYYLFDGDAQRGFEIVNGSLVNTFSTFSIGYPASVRDTIWLGDRDDNSAVEYGLNGVATGNSSVGGGGFSQLLDGASGHNANFGIECCGSTNSVTTANTDWTGQSALFTISSQGTGIAYDLSDDTLYISENSSVISQYSLAGTLLNSFNLSLVALAYEQVTDTFWGYNRGNNNIVQFDRLGNTLSQTFVTGVSGNIWGGEMVVAAASVPEPGVLALIAMALGGMRIASRRKSNEA